MRKRRTGPLAGMISLAAAAGACSGATTNSFNGVGTPFQLSSFGVGSAASLGTVSGGTPMLILAQGAGSSNAAAFDQTDDWSSGGVDAAFTMNFGPSGDPTGSLEFGLLESGDFGTSGAGPMINSSGAANVVDSFVLAIDLKSKTVSGGFYYVVAPTTSPAVAAAQAVADIGAAVANIMSDIGAARNQGNALAAQTCTDQLSQAKATQAMAAQRLADVQSAVARGDNDGAQHALTILQQLAASVQQNNTTSGQAVGRNSVTPPGEEEQTTPMPPNVPMDDDPDCEIQIIPTADGSGSEVTATVTDPSGASNVIFDEEFSNLIPYESRVEFGAATDDPAAGVGIDDLDVQFNTVPEPTMVFAIGMVGLGLTRGRRR